MTDLVSVAEDIGVSVASGLEREQTRKTYTSGNLSECSWEDCTVCVLSASGIPGSLTVNFLARGASN